MKRIIGSMGSLVAISILGLAMTLPGSAQTGVIKISDNAGNSLTVSVVSGNVIVTNGPTCTVTGGGACYSTTSANTFAGVRGALSEFEWGGAIYIGNFVVSTPTGTRNSPSELDLGDSVALAGPVGSTAQTLTLSLSDIGFTGAAGAKGILNGTVTGGTMTFQAYFDATNSYYGATGANPQLIQTISAAGGTTQFATYSDPTAAFSLTEVQTYTFPAGAPASSNGNTIDGNFYANWPSVACPAASETVGVAIASTTGASGGTAPYTYTAAGNLPPGLSFNTSTGVFSGTPTTAGTYTITGATATDANSNVSGNSCTVTVVPPPVTLSCPATLTGTVGTAYSGSLTAAGGSSPYTFSISSGALPGGLSLSAGAITGTPTTATTGDSVVFLVTDSTKPTAETKTASCNFVISSSSSSGGSSSGGSSSGGSSGGSTKPAPLVINCPKVTTGGEEKSPFSATISVTGGTGPYTIALTSGSLPTGLKLNSTTSATGSASATITGTPTDYGTFKLVFTVTDASTKTSVSTTSCGSSCAIVITPAPCQVSGHSCSQSQDWWGNWNTKGNSGQTVSCTGTDCDGNKVYKTCTTGSDGSYCFSGLKPGKYSVTAPTQCYQQDSWGNWGCKNLQTTSCYNVAPDHGATITGCEYSYK